MVVARRAGKLLLWTLLVGVPLFVVAYTIAYFAVGGDSLAHYVSDKANEQICGKLEIGNAKWSYWNPWRAHVRDLKILDPLGREILFAKEAEASVDLLGLRRGDIVMHDLWAAPGTRVLIDTDPKNGFFAAFASCKGGYRHPPGPPSDKGGRVHFDGQLDDVAIGLRLGQTLALDAPHVKSHLYADAKGRNVRVDVKPTAPAGTVSLFGVPLPFVDLAVASFGTTDARPDDLALDLHAGVRGAGLHVAGAVTQAFTLNPGVDVTIDVDKAGDALHDLVAGLVPDLEVGGAAAGGRVHLHGPMLGFRVDADVHGLEGALAGVPAKATDAAGSIHFQTDTGKLGLEKVSAQILGGKLEVPSADVDTMHGALAARARLEHVDVTTLVPPGDRPMVGGKLTGTLHLSGNVGHTLRATDIDVLLERTSTRKGPLPARIKLAGALDYDVPRGKLNLDGLKATGDTLTATASGGVSLRSRAIDLQFSAAASPLLPILRRMGVSVDVARAARAKGRAQGSLDRAGVKAQLDVDGLGISNLRIPHTTAQMEIAGDTLSLSEIHGGSPAGSLSGSARVDLKRQETDATLKLTDLDLSLLGSTGPLALKGRATVDIQAAGAIDHPTGHASLRAQELAIGGDPYRDAELSADLTQRGAEIRKLRLSRARGGGLEGTGMVGWDRVVNLHLKAGEFPLAAVPGLAELPVDIRGTVSGEVDVSGTIDAPRPAGTVRLRGAAAGGVVLGDGDLQLIPGGDAIHLSGNFFKRFQVDGSLTVQPGLALSATITFQGVPIEQIFPAMSRLGEVRGVASGKVDVAFSASGAMHVAARLSELRLTAKVTEEDGTPRHLALSNEDEVRIVYDGVRTRFDHLHMKSDQGELLVRGYLDPAGSDLEVRGTVDLELIEYFAHQYFNHTHGTTVANLRVRGPMKRPVVTGTLQLEKVVLDPVDFDHHIAIPGGLLTFNNDGVELRDFMVAVGEAQARASGRLGLRDWQPTTMHLEVDGRVSAQLLELAAPRLLSEVHGGADVKVVVDGPAGNPNISGRVAVAQPGIELDVRSYGRRVQILEGEVQLQEHKLRIDQLHAKIDDGDLRLGGSITLDGLAPKDVRLRIHAVDLPHREPGVYEVTVAGDLDLTGDTNGLNLRGRVSLVDGRYIQKFDIVKNTVIRPRTNEGGSPPFWSGVDLLSDLQLDLQVDSAGPLVVDNDIARQLKLDAHLQVGGSLSEPDFAGEITVVEGTFRIPFFGGDDFTAERGKITFYRGRSIPDEAPELDIEADKPFTDANEQDHMVTLRLKGALGWLNLDLSTNDGLNSAQTATMLVTGRPPTELRSEFRGGSGSTANPTDQVAKEATGQVLQELLSDPIKNALRLNVLSIYVGPESVDVKLRKRLIDHPRLDLLGAEQIGLANRSVYEGQVQLKLHDFVFIDSEIQHLTQGTETEEEVLTRGKVQLRLKYRWRF
jgi:autotransporter translocation and assembly factor TamB